jgi:hypothetical protein
MEIDISSLKTGIGCGLFHPSLQIVCKAELARKRIALKIIFPKLELFDSHSPISVNLT